MKKSLVVNVVLGLFVLLMLMSCASIIGKSGPETLNIRSTPDQASIAVLDEGGAKIFEGMTPTTVALEKKRGYFKGKKYTVTISKAGCVPHTVTVDTRANGWYLGGNIIFGGLIGWIIVDPLTGAMWTLDSNEINVSLNTASPAAKNDSGNVSIVLLQDVPSSLRNKMVKVSQ